MPDDRYYESLAWELEAVKNRIRDLVHHWPTDGAWKEAALRTVLRRHLPTGSFVGRGFIVAREQSSKEIDVLILRPNKPTLFRDGDLAIVTPDAPGAIVEVKTKLEGQAQWTEAIKALGQNGEVCKKIGNNEPWLGLFSYGGDLAQVDNILNAISSAYSETKIAVNAVMAGYDVFIRYWPAGEYEPGDDVRKDLARRYWRAYQLPQLAPSYFVSNLIDAICNLDRGDTDYVWFARPNGKRPQMVAERQVEDGEADKGDA